MRTYGTEDAPLCSAPQAPPPRCTGVGCAQSCATVSKAMPKAVPKLALKTVPKADPSVRAAPHAWPQIALA